MNDVVVVWLFYPFYSEKAEELWVSHYYKNLNNSLQKSAEWYISYLQDLSDHYHDNIPINQNSFVELLIEILKEFSQNEEWPESLWNNVDNEYKQIIYEKLQLWASDR
jgi:hypothetical protein